MSAVCRKATSFLNKANNELIENGLHVFWRDDINNMELFLIGPVNDECIKILFSPEVYQIVKDEKKSRNGFAPISFDVEAIGDTADFYGERFQLENAHFINIAFSTGSTPGSVRIQTTHTLTTDEYAHVVKEVFPLMYLGGGFTSFGNHLRNLAFVYRNSKYLSDKERADFFEITEMEKWEMLCGAAKEENSKSTGYENRISFFQRQLFYDGIMAICAVDDETIDLVDSMLRDDLYVDRRRAEFMPYLYISGGKLKYAADFSSTGCDGIVRTSCASNGGACASRRDETEFVK